ncbi:MAG: glycosyltransferase family 2 protein [Patescibacteria group bacterium]|nr:glycosyltransferase family 2 protein [Patescibacteria group bacterium]
MNSCQLSIIIVSYNTQKITFDCIQSIIRSLINSTISYEIIVIDNASSDNTINALKKINVKQLRIIKNKKNLGFGKANNQGVKIAQGEYLLFLNSDIIVLNNSIEKMFKFYKQNEKKFNFLGGKLLNKNLTYQPSCGSMYTLPIIFAHLFLKGDYWGLTRYSPKRIKKVDWISGACILTKKEYFEKLKGFDEKIFMYMEEIDLFYRAKKLGMKIFFYPDAQFIHLGSASSNQRTYPILQVYQGLLYFYQKHYDFFSNFLLKLMLKLKALIGILIGKISKNNYLINTYEKAWSLVKLV